ncbi:HalOD1 output domain-containing protein [Natrialbaceae archaeon A-gly3]
MYKTEDQQVSHHVSRAVIEAKAEKEGVEPTALPPLYESVEPEALDSLFEHTKTGTARKMVIEFVYDGSLVRVAVDDGFIISISERGGAIE